LKQGLNVLEAGIDLNFRKNEMIASKEQSSGAHENGVQQERRDTSSLKICLQYNVDLIPIDPWRFVLFWRGIAEEVFANFRFDFQILNENELECFGFYMEFPNSVDRVEVGEGHKFRHALKKAFASLSGTFAKSANPSLANHDGVETSEKLKLKIYSKADLVSSK
jgi:hypothetical protein